MISLLLLPSLVRFLTYASVGSWFLILTIATRYRAAFACLFPPQLSLNLCVFPLDAGIGHTPHSLASAASERMRFGLAAQAEQVLAEDPYSGHLFVFRGRRGDLLKIIWWDQQGACLFSKRLEKGRFVWPAAKDGKISLSGAQLSMLLEGIDWRMPQKTWRPLSVG